MSVGRTGMIIPSAIISRATVIRMKVRAALRVFIFRAELRHGARSRQTRIKSMNSSNQDKVEGTVKKTVGAVKEKPGELVGNPNLQDKGTAKKVEGEVQQKVGDVKKVFEQ